MLVLPSRRGAPPIITQVRDPDARAFIQRVQAADGAPLETAVMTALDRFVIGCKADGIWTAIKACCVMAGARTLAGALTPLVGPAPTNINFVGDDYSRTLGLLGNGAAAKYLDTNCPMAGFARNNVHAVTWANGRDGSTGRYISGANTNAAVVSVLGGTPGFRARVNEGTLRTHGTTTDVPKLVGVSRGSASEYTWVYADESGTESSTSTGSEPTGNLMVFASNAPGNYISVRQVFYSAGEALSLTALRARVTTLMADIAAALP